MKKEKKTGIVSQQKRLLIVASKNRGKLEEIRALMSDMPLKVISQEEAGFYETIDETGSSFEENALIKARAIHDKTKNIVLSDDSGLEVDCLNGAPGIYSARFAGEGATDAQKNDKLLKMVKEAACYNAAARFVCAAAIVMEDGSEFTVRGECEGVIADEPAGENGFGYDPVFFIPELNKTMAQLDKAGKNQISHRGKALNLLKQQLTKML